MFDYIEHVADGLLEMLGFTALYHKDNPVSPTPACTELERRSS